MNALHSAALEGSSIDCLDYLIAQGLTPDASVLKRRTAILHTTAYRGSVPMVQHVWEAIPEMQKKKKKKGNDASFSAGNSLDCLTDQTSQRMDKDTRTICGYTLFEEAAYEGNVPILQRLCQALAGWKNLENQRGTNAIVLAVRGGSLVCVKYLISQGVNTKGRSKKGDTLLHLAAFCGSLPIVQYINETFPDLKNERNEKGQNALYRAARGGNLDCFKYLIDEGMDTDTRSKDGHTVLHAAAHGGHVTMVQYIFEKYPSIKNETDEKGMCAIFSAVRGGSLDCFIYLTGQGMRTDTESKYGSTVLHEAAFKGSLAMVQHICKTFPDLKNKSNQKGMNALFGAVRGKSLDCLKYLLSQGLDKNTRSADGNTLLHTAANGGSIPILKYLCETFPDLMNKKGEDASYSAILGGSFDCFKYLIGQGLKSDTCSKAVDTLLHTEVNGGSEPIVKFFFVTFSSLIKERNMKGEGNLNNATLGESIDCLKYLIGKGLIPDTRLKAVDTLLHTAVYGRSLPIVQYLFNKCPALIQERNKTRQDALNSAAFGGSLDCLKYLIDQGLILNARPKTVNTILHTAIYRGSVSIVQYLCETFPGIIKEENRKGKAALHSAVHGGSIDCLKYVIGQGFERGKSSQRRTTLMHTAVYGGSVPMVQYVWETFPYLQHLKYHKGYATQGNNLDCLKYLISHGMKIDTRYKYRHALLKEAACKGIVSIVQYLCETYSGLKNERNKEEPNALISAVRGGSLDCVKYLINYGLNANTQTKNGDTLLHVAAFSGSLPIVKYICETYPEMKNEINTKGEDSLHSAARGGSLACLIYLIDQEMTIYSWSINDETILHHAAFNGHEDVVRYICENYSELIGYKQNHGRTAIYSAVFGGHLDILKYLLIQIDPNQTDNFGRTILHAATKKGNTDIVEYLCSTYRFLIHMTGFKGETAKDLALRNKYPDCIKMIQEHL